MFRFALVVALSGLLGAAAMAASPDQTGATESLMTPEQIMTDALRQSVGAPARADLGDQATVRLDGELLVVPKDIAAKLLKVSDIAVPANFVALLVGSEGMQVPGFVRFVPAGFVDSDAALHWTADDFMASLRQTVQRDNKAREASGLEAQEVRQWIRAPDYNPERHRLSWASMMVPKGSPREADGAVTFHALAFGRSGYIELTLVSSEEKAGVIGDMVTTFLAGVSFRPGHGYADVQPGDPRSATGLAGAMGIDSLQKAEATTSLFGSDIVMPLAGGIVAAIGAISLLLYIQRHMRRESRRG